jgi:hypothetical protein
MPFFVNATPFDFDQEKFYDLVHDHSLHDYSESDRTQWLEVLRGMGGGVSSAWTHVFVHRLLQLKHSLLNYALAEEVPQTVITVSWGTKIIDDMITASDGEWLTVLSEDTKTFECLKTSLHEKLELIPHLQREKFNVEWDARALRKTVNIQLAQFQKLFKKHQRMARSGLSQPPAG